MKSFILTALLATVAFANHNQNLETQTQWPWQVGMRYRYDVESQTLARLPEGANSGSALRATFIIRVKTSGQLLAKLEDPQRAEIHQEFTMTDRNRMFLPEGLKFEPVKKLDQPFEIKVEGGRVTALSMPESLSLAHENLLKGLISTLQVDLSTHRTVHKPQSSFDWETLQGQFRKMETDVTGDCDTRYTVTPAASEWRRELPTMSVSEDPIMVTKSKNYDHCHHRVAYHFGLTEVAEWTGTAEKPEKEQLINHASNSRILVGKQGPIFKAETTDIVKVHPFLYGRQKAEVHSYVKLSLVSFEQDSESDIWQSSSSNRVIQNLLYSMSSKRISIRDQSDESFEQEDVQVVDSDNNNRLRRSVKMPKKIVSINKIVINKRSDNDDREDSSSSDSTSAYVNDDTPQNNEPAYAALYMNPQTHEAAKQNPANALKLVQELGLLLQNTDNMPKSDFLSKFNILVRVIAGMDSEQLTQTSRSIEMAKATNNIIKSDMWMIFRDAVVQAGTLPAFNQILTWIQAKKIQGEEAAQVVSALPNTLRYPTKQIMLEFFEFAMSPEVTQQEYLNTTALIAACKFINMGQVNNVTAHSYYPTHMYGRLARKHDNFVYEDVLPRLRQALEQAIQQEDSIKAQVYIKAIGLLGHRSILEVFAPYLEGNVPVSTYLRTLMVENLYILAREKDSYTRAVLYSILRNTAEPYEVRVVAIQNIFAAHPTTSMMLAMAQMTHDDPSVQVRAVIKSAIETAAEQRNPSHIALARTAQAARPMLTRERFGKQFSSRVYSEYFDSDYELSIMGVLSTIGSEDSLFPKYLKYNRWSQTNSWDSISASTSNVQKLVETVQQYMYSMQENHPEQTQSNHKYSASKISEMLNIKRDPQTPFEAALFFGLWNHHRYFTFSEQDLIQLPNVIKELIQDISRGLNVHYTKVFNQAQVSVMFPVASGMPFIFKYKEPTVVHIQAKVQKSSASVQFTYARNIDGSVGFLDTLSNKVASVGVVNKIQLNLPVKVEIVNGGVHLQHLRPEQDTTIAHYSVWPYTTIQKKDTLVPISLDPVTKLITRQSKVISLKPIFGNQFGLWYELQGYSYSRDYRNALKMFQNNNWLSNIIMAVYQKDVASTHFNLRYLGKKSENKGITLSVAYDYGYNMKDAAPSTDSKVISESSLDRRNEMMARVAAGIKTANAQVIDLNVALDTLPKKEFVFTAAIASSQVDPKIQYAFFAGRRNDDKSQISRWIDGVGKVVKPEEAYLNAQEALTKELKMNFDAEVRIESGEEIHIQGMTERTKKYVELLKNLPVANLCAEQMNHNNFYQHACHKMIIMSQVPDYLKASVTYKFGTLSPALKEALSQAFKMASSILQHQQWYYEVNPLKTIAQGKLEIEIQNDYLERIMNMNVNSRFGELKLKNVPIPAVTNAAYAVYYPIRPYERVANYFTSHLYQPYCSVDGNQIKTFSNRNLSYSVSPSWHVVMQDAPRSQPWQDELVVLTRRPTESQQEIYISYQSETGYDMEINIQPVSGKPNVQVKTNAEKKSEGDLTIYWDAYESLPLLQYYVQPDGVLMLSIRLNRLRIMHDGQRMVVLTNYGRNNTRGICGLMNGEKRDDYWTPKGLVDSDDLYAASYALIEGSDEKTQQLQAEAQKMAYQRLYQYTNLLRSDSEWQKWQNADSNEDSLEDWSSDRVYRSRGHLKQPRGTCVLSKQVQYYETSSQICITMTPLEACPSHCKAEGLRLQPARVVCRSRLDSEFQQCVSEINQGQNPLVSGDSQMRQYRVPSSCRA